jgi:hypothetical protein
MLSPVLCLLNEIRDRASEMTRHWQKTDPEPFSVRRAGWPEQMQIEPGMNDRDRNQPRNRD